jgi:hypothetical protein
MIELEDSKDCPVCREFHFPEPDEVDNLCVRHLLQLFASLILGEARAKREADDE